MLFYQWSNSLSEQNLVKFNFFSQQASPAIKYAILFVSPKSDSQIWPVKYTSDLNTWRVPVYYAMCLFAFLLTDDGEVSKIPMAEQLPHHWPNS